MNEFEPEQLEVELQRLRPAAAPEELIARLAAHSPGTGNSYPARPPIAPGRFLPGRWFGWFAPLAAAAAAAFFYIRHPSEPSGQPPPQMAPAAMSAVKADNVEIVQQLVATFDAVAHLPGGEPVRFRCSEWFDDVVLRDSAKGILIEHRIPRLEVQPVGFETY